MYQKSTLQEVRAFCPLTYPLPLEGQGTGKGQKGILSHTRSFRVYSTSLARRRGEKRGMALSTRPAVGYLRERGYWKSEGRF